MVLGGFLLLATREKLKLGSGQNSTIDINLSSIWHDVLVWCLLEINLRMFAIQNGFITDEKSDESFLNGKEIMSEFVLSCPVKPHRKCLAILLANLYFFFIFFFLIKDVHGNLEVNFFVVIEKLLLFCQILWQVVIFTNLILRLNFVELAREFQNIKTWMS